MSLPISRWFSVFARMLSRRVGREEKSSTSNAGTEAVASFLRQATSIAEMVKNTTTPLGGIPSTEGLTFGMPGWQVTDGKNWVFNYDRGEIAVPDLSSAPKSPGTPRSSITIISAGARWYARDWESSPALALFLDPIQWPRA